MAKPTPIPHVDESTRRAYERAGWGFTLYNRPDPGATVGPCVQCRTPCVRYGPNGRARCPDCAPTGPTTEG